MEENERRSLEERKYGELERRVEGHTRDLLPRSLKYDLTPSPAFLSIKSDQSQKRVKKLL